VGIIDRGQMQVSAEVTDIIRQVRGRTILHIGVRQDLDRALSLLESQEMVDIAAAGDGFITCTLAEGTEDYSPLATLLVQSGFQLTMLREEEINLESAFMALTKGVGAKI
jgi:ABC-2 type transport system ATP-binding protein